MNISKGLGPITCTASGIIYCERSWGVDDDCRPEIQSCRPKPQTDPHGQHSFWSLLTSCRRPPSPPAITVESSGFAVFVIETLTSHYHSRRLRLCRLHHRNPYLPLSQQETQALSSSSAKPSPPTITAGDSGSVVFIIETLTSHYHSRRLRLCRLRQRNPRLPLSQRETQALSSSSSKPSPPTIKEQTQAVSSSSSKPSPPTITAGDSGSVVFVIETLTSHYHSKILRLCHLRHRNHHLPLCLRRRNRPTTYTK